MAIGDNFDTTKKGQKNDFLTDRVSGHGPTHQDYMSGNLYAPQDDKSDDNLGHPCNVGCGCAEIGTPNDRTLGESGCLLPPELTIKLAASSSRDYARLAMGDPKNEGATFKTFHLKHHNGAWRGRRCCQTKNEKGDVQHDGSGPLELCDPCEVTTHLDGAKSQCNFFGKEGTGREFPIGLPEKAHPANPQTGLKPGLTLGVTSRYETTNRNPIGWCGGVAGKGYEHPSGKVGWMTEDQCKSQLSPGSWTGQMTGQLGCHDNGEPVPKKDPHCYVLDPDVGSSQFSTPLPTGWFQAENVIFVDNEGDCENGEAIQRLDLNTGKIERIGRCVCVEGCEKSLADIPAQSGDEVWDQDCGGDVVFDNKLDCEDHKSECIDIDNKVILTQYTKPDSCLDAPGAGVCSDPSLTAAGKDVCTAIPGNTWEQKYVWASNSVIYGSRKWYPAQCVQFDTGKAQCASPDGWKLAKDCKRDRGPRYIPTDEKELPFQDIITERYECLSVGICSNQTSGEDLSSKEAHCTESSISDPTACRANGYKWIEVLNNKKECEREGDCSDTDYDNDKCECLKNKETFTETNVWNEGVWTTRWHHSVPDGSGCCSGFFISEGTSGNNQPAVEAAVVGQDTCVNCYEEVILMDVSEINLSHFPALASEGVGGTHYSQDGDGRGSGEFALIWRGCDFCKTCEEQGTCYNDQGSDLGLTKSQCSSGTMTWVSSQGGESKIFFLPLNQILNCTDIDLQHYEDTAYEWANPLGHRPADIMACDDVSMGGQQITNLGGDCEVYIYEEGAALAGALPDSATRSVLAKGEYETRLLNMQKQPFKLSEKKQCNYKTAEEADGDSWTIAAALGFQFQCKINNTKFWFDHDIAPMAGWWQTFRAQWKNIIERQHTEDGINVGDCLGNRVSGKDCCGGRHEYCNYCGPCAAELEALVNRILNDPNIVYPTTRPGSFDYWKRTGLVPECPGTGKGTGYSSFVSETCYGVDKTGTIQFASNTKPIIIKSIGHGLKSGDAIRVDGVLGNFAANIMTTGMYQELQWGASKKAEKCEAECGKIINPADACTTCPHATPPGKETPLPMWVVDVISPDNFAIRDCNGKDSDGRVTVHMGKEGACGIVDDIPGYGTTTESSQSDPLTGESGSKHAFDVWECCPNTGTWELGTDIAGVLGGGTDTMSGPEGWHLRGSGFLKQDDSRPELEDWYVDIIPSEACPSCCDHWMPPALIATVGDPGTSILDKKCGVDCNGDELPALKAGYIGSAHCSPIGYCVEDGVVGDQKNPEECDTAQGDWTPFNTQSICEEKRCWSNGSKTDMGDPLPALGDEDACLNRDDWPGYCSEPLYGTIDVCQENGETWYGTHGTLWRGAPWTEAGFVQFTGPDGRPGQWFGDGHCCDCDYSCSNPETGEGGLVCGCRKCEDRRRFLDEPVCRSGADDAFAGAANGYCKDDHCCSCECCPGDSKKAVYTDNVDYPTLEQFRKRHGKKCQSEAECSDSTLTSLGKTICEAIPGNTWVYPQDLCLGNLCCTPQPAGGGGTCEHDPNSESVDEGQCYARSASKIFCELSTDCMWKPQAGDDSGTKKFYDKNEPPPSTACAGFFNNRPMSCEAQFLCSGSFPREHECIRELKFDKEAGCTGFENPKGRGKGNVSSCLTCGDAITTGCDRFQAKPKKEACPGLGTMDVLLEWTGFKWISDWTPMKPDSSGQFSRHEPGAPGCYVPPFVGGRQCLHHKLPSWMGAGNPWRPPYCPGNDCNFCGNCETAKFNHNVPPGDTPCPTAGSSAFYLQLELGCGSALDMGGHGYPTFDSYFEHGLNLKANITTCEYNAAINSPCPDPLTCGRDWNEWVGYGYDRKLKPPIPHRSIPGVNCGPSPPCTECCDFERPGACYDTQGALTNITTEAVCRDPFGDGSVSTYSWAPPATDGCGRSGKVYGSDPAACMNLQGSPPNDGGHRSFRKQPDVFEVYDVQYAAGPKYKGEYSDIITARSVGVRPCVWYEGDKVSIGLADRTAAETGGKYFHSNNVGGLGAGDMTPSSTDILSANSEYPSSTFLVVDKNAPKQVGGANHDKRIALKMPIREQVDGLLHGKSDEYDIHQFMQFNVADANALTGHNRHINRNLYRGGLDTIPPEDWAAGNKSRHRGGMNYPGQPSSSTFGARSLTHEPWPYGDGSYPVAPQSESQTPMGFVYQPNTPMVGPLTNLFRIGKKLILGNIGHKDHILNPAPIIDPATGEPIAQSIGIQPVLDGEGGGHLNEIKSIKEKWDKTVPSKPRFLYYTITTAFPHDLITGEKIWLDAAWSNSGQCTFNEGVMTGEGAYSACYDQTGTNVIRSELTDGLMKEANNNPLTDLPYDDLDCADALHWPPDVTSTTWEKEKEYITCLGAKHCEKPSLKLNSYTDIKVDQDYCTQPTFGLCRDNEKNGLLVKSDEGYCTIEGRSKEDCGKTSGGDSPTEGGTWVEPSFDVLDEETCVVLADKRGNCTLDHERTREKNSCIGGICEKGERTQSECARDGLKWLHGQWIKKEYEWMKGPGKWENSGFFNEGCASSLAVDEEASDENPCNGCYLRCIKQNWFYKPPGDEGNECNAKDCCDRDDFCPTSKLNGEWVVKVIDNTHFIPVHPLYADPEQPMKSGFLKSPFTGDLVGKEYDPSNGECVTGATANPPYASTTGYDSQADCEAGGHLWLLENPPVNTRWTYMNRGVPGGRDWDSFAPGYPQGSDVGVGAGVGPFGEFYEKKGTCIRETTASGTSQKRNVTEDFPSQVQCEARGAATGSANITFKWVSPHGGIQGEYNGVWTRHGGVFKIVVGSHDGTPWPGKNCRQAGSHGPVDLDFWFLEMPEACCNIHFPLEDNVCGEQGYPGYGPTSEISDRLDGAALLVNIHELSGSAWRGIIEVPPHGGRTGSIKRYSANMPEEVVSDPPDPSNPPKDHVAMLFMDESTAYQNSYFSRGSTLFKKHIAAWRRFVEEADISAKICLIQPIGTANNDDEIKGPYRLLPPEWCAGRGVGDCKFPDFVDYRPIGRAGGDGALAEMKAAFLKSADGAVPKVLGLFVDISGSMDRRTIAPAVDDFIEWYKAYSLEETDVEGCVIEIGTQSEEWIAEAVVAARAAIKECR